jgi:UDP:flavonoid glycosyltransferase YjiC (YdhE family)
MISPRPSGGSCNGPPAPDLKNLTADTLAKAIDSAVNDSTMRANAEALGQKIRAENGVARAVELIEKQESKSRNIN